MTQQENKVTFSSDFPLVVVMFYWLNILSWDNIYNFNIFIYTETYVSGAHKTPACRSAWVLIVRKYSTSSCLIAYCQKTKDLLLKMLAASSYSTVAVSCFQLVEFGFDLFAPWNLFLWLPQTSSFTVGLSRFFRFCVFELHCAQQFAAAPNSKHSSRVLTDGSKHTSSGIHTW